MQRSSIHNLAPFKPGISLWLLYHSLSGPGFQASVFSSFVFSAGGHEWEVVAKQKADHGSIAETNKVRLGNGSQKKCAV